MRALQVNRLHEVIKGKDPITGGYYDALDHEQLLWVHACLQLSSIYFYEKTVRKLSDDQKDRYHKENMLAAKLDLVNIDQMPVTHKDLKDWVIKKSRSLNYLEFTDVAECTKYHFWRTCTKTYKTNMAILYHLQHSILFQMNLKLFYGVKTTKIKTLILSFNLLFFKNNARPFLPPFLDLFLRLDGLSKEYKKPDLKFR